MSKNSVSTPFPPKVQIFHFKVLEPLRIFLDDNVFCCSDLVFRNESLSFVMNGKKWQIPYQIAGKFKIQKHEHTYLYCKIRNLSYDAVRFNLKIGQYLNSIDKGQRFEMHNKRYRLIFECSNFSDMDKLINFSDRFTLNLNYTTRKNMKELTTSIVNQYGKSLDE